MELNEISESELTKKYRNELFETEGISISEIDNLISDDDLKMIIGLNNREMCELINKRPLDEDLIHKLLVANINFYKLAKYRKLSIHGSSFLMTIASSIDYDVDKLYDELNVGGYHRPFRSR